MSSFFKIPVISMALLLLYPMTALADIKVIVNPPAYKYNPYNYKHYNPKHYSNKYKDNKRYYNKYRYKKEKFNKYNYPPYSYSKNRFNYRNDILRPSYSRIYNYNPYANNYNKYQYQKEKSYWQGYKDGYNQQRKNYRLGK